MSLPVVSASTVTIALVFCLVYAIARIDVLNAWVISGPARRNGSTSRARHAYRKDDDTAYRPDVERYRRALAVASPTMTLRAIEA